MTHKGRTKTVSLIDPAVVRAVAKRILCTPVISLWIIDQDKKAKMVRVGIRVNEAHEHPGFSIRLTAHLLGSYELSSRGIIPNVFVALDPPGTKIG